MPRFADVAHGTRSTKPVKLSLPGSADPVDVLVRPLNGLELGRVDAMARAYAVGEIKRARAPDDARPIPEPREGDRLYDLGNCAATLLLGCLDAADPTRPFFADVEEILGGLGPEWIVLLYEEQQAFQDECAPRPDKGNGAAFMAVVMGEAALEEGAPGGPFSRLRPTTQQIFFRILAKQHVTSLLHRSPSSSAGDAAGPT